MTEASVSSAFMSALRKRLPEAVIIKHRDASFIGLPDCSVTYGGRVWWLEFKLWQPPKRWSILDPIPAQQIAEKSPAQYDMMKKMARASTGAYYIVWAKKQKMCCVWMPFEGFVPQVLQQADLVEWIGNNCLAALGQWPNS